MHLAVALKNIEMIKVLVRLGADAEIKDLSGKTPLDYVQNKQDIFFKRLCDIIDPRKRTSEMGISLASGAKLLQMD